MSRPVQPQNEVPKPGSEGSEGSEGSQRARVVGGGDGDLQRGRPHSDQRRMTSPAGTPPNELLLLSDPTQRMMVVNALARVILEEESRSGRGGFRRDG